MTGNLNVSQAPSIGHINQLATPYGNMSMNSDRKTGGKALRAFRNSGLDIAIAGREPNSSTLKMAPGLMSPTGGKNGNKYVTTASMNASMDGGALSKK